MRTNQRQMPNMCASFQPRGYTKNERTKNETSPLDGALCVFGRRIWKIRHVLQYNEDKGTRREAGGEIGLADFWEREREKPFFFCCSAIDFGWTRFLHRWQLFFRCHWTRNGTEIWFESSNISCTSYETQFALLLTCLFTCSSVRMISTRTNIIRRRGIMFCLYL